MSYETQPVTAHRVGRSAMLGTIKPFQSGAASPSQSFNIAAHNRDDHAKNFAFMLDDQTGDWSLAPAYDLTHSPGPGGEHTTTVLGEGRHPTRGHCLKLAEQAGIKRTAETIIEEVNAAIGRWPHFADQAACTEEDHLDHRQDATAVMTRPI